MPAYGWRITRIICPSPLEAHPMESLGTNGLHYENCRANNNNNPTDSLSKMQRFSLPSHTDSDSPSDSHLQQECFEISRHSRLTCGLLLHTHLYPSIILLLRRAPWPLHMSASNCIQSSLPTPIADHKGKRETVAGRRKSRHLG